MLKKNRFLSYLKIIFMGCLLIPLYSCRTEDKPDVTTNNAKNITQTSAICGGYIWSNGNDYIEGSGVEWSEDKNFGTSNSKEVYSGSVMGNFEGIISDLTPNTKYYFKAYAYNSVGTSYGSTKNFTTLQASAGGVIDIDGNLYDTVVIGTQTWLVQNLKVSRLNDCTNIALVIGETDWANQTASAYCWFDNDESSYKNTYGAMYNWFAVNTGKLCPEGWHVPSHAEWVTLVNYASGDTIAGGKLKETGTDHWGPPNIGATNEFGFTARGGGQRSGNDGFYYLRNETGYWWSTKEEDPDDAWSWVINSDVAVILNQIGYKKDAYSVRCIKD